MASSVRLFRGRLFVQLDGVGVGNAGGAILFELRGSLPIHQRLGQFLPFVAFRAQIANTIALDFPAGRQLVGTIFEDEALGELLGGDGEREQRKSGKSKKPGG